VGEQETQAVRWVRLIRQIKHEVMGEDFRSMGLNVPHAD